MERDRDKKGGEEVPVHKIPIVGLSLRYHIT